MVRLPMELQILINSICSIRHHYSCFLWILASQRQIILGLNVDLTARTNVPKDEENLLADDIVSCIYPVTVLLEILICWSNSLSLSGFIHCFSMGAINGCIPAEREREKKYLFIWDIFLSCIKNLFIQSIWYT